MQQFLKYKIALLFAAVFACLSYIWFFDFTADDSFILFRYAENFIHRGELSFNPGERINALTSPLHAILTIVISFLAGSNILIASKLFMAFLLYSCVYIIIKKHIHAPKAYLPALIAFLLSPFVLMWTYGGLETILLMLIITSMAAISVENINLQRFYTVCFLAGLAFLARFDSVLFTVPFVSIYFLVNYKHFLKVNVIAKAAFLFAVLPVLWLSFSLWYFKDVFPTSFYLKIETAFNIYTIVYCFQFFVFTGAIPFYVFSITQIFITKQKSALLKHFSQYAHIYIALVCITFYGFANANVHMMFGYRLLLPYLGAIFIIILNLLYTSFNKKWQNKAFLRNEIYVSLLILFTFLQLIHCKYIYKYSLNGFSCTGEFREGGISDWNNYMNVMAQSAEDLKKHIASQAKFGQRLASFSTSSEGLIPYIIKDLYVYGDLVSMRKIGNSFTGTYTQNRNYAFMNHSDYVYIGLPFQKNIYDSLIQMPDKYKIISKRGVAYKYGQLTYYVFYNPNPQPLTLPRYVRNLPAEIL